MKKYIVLLALIFIQGCSSGGGDDDTTLVTPPSIISFTSSLATITVGEDTTLTGVFENGTGSIDANVGIVTSGVDVTVTPTITNTYTLTVTNVAGASVSAQVTVTVIPAPSITSFNAAESNVTLGSSTTLTGVFSNGTGIIDNGVGVVVSDVGVVVTPTTTTTYTLTVTNTEGVNVSAQVTVVVTPASPAVTSIDPVSDSTTALVGTNVTAVFRDEMDGATVESGFSLTLNSTPVAATVIYDDTTKIATLSPDIDLVSGAEYRAIIASSVKDINGNAPLSTDYVWSFTISPAMLLTSKNANGVTGNNISQAADIDATGRYIVFESTATNLASIATTLNRSHIYRKDTITGEVILVSSDKSGLVEANNQAGNPSISTNGRYVVFESAADNLDGNASGNIQVYLKDLDNGAVTLVSRNIEGIPDEGFNGAANAKVSDDGRYVLFQSSDRQMSAIDGGGIVHIYQKDMSTGIAQMVSRTAAGAAGNAASNNPDMSADGTHIVFESLATNFTASNSFNHIFYVNTSVSHTVEQISVATGGAEANADSNKPSVSDDGSIVIFHTDATNLDGADNNGTTDVYLHYRPSSTELISANPSTGESGNGASSNAHISGNADYVVFESLASDLASGSISGVRSIFVRDLSVLPEIIIEKVDIPPSTLPSNEPVISTDGRYVSFHSDEAYADDTDRLSDVFRAHNSTSQ